MRHLSLDEAVAQLRADFVRIGVGDPLVGCTQEQARSLLERAFAVWVGSDPVSVVAAEFPRLLIELEDQRRVTALVLGSEVEAQLSATATLASAMQDSGYPAPEFVVGPVRLPQGWLMIESEPTQALSQPTVAQLAQELHRFVQLATTLSEQASPGSAGLLRWSLERWPPFTPLMPAPPARPNEEFEELAESARTRVAAPSEPWVVTHLGWSERNVRFGADSLCAVRGWEQLLHVPAAGAIGLAAASFRNSTVHAEQAPTPEESDRFVAAYAQTRGQPLSESERKTVGAFRTMALVLQASATSAQDVEPGSAAEMLLRFGERYLVVRA
jgi:hypothetical protein